jgi:hypothetical protein
MYLKVGITSRVFFPVRFNAFTSACNFGVRDKIIVQISRFEYLGGFDSAGYIILSVYNIEGMSLKLVI